jgi:serine/threonine-protein kinase HipA
VLKLNPPDVPRLVENEHFFMTAALACDLRPAEVRLLHDRDDKSGLLVTRFDRRNGEKLHQEDACQMLDLYPADKYRLSVRDALEALEVCSAPRIERLRLLRLVAFSYLIGNGDLHGKNVSVRVVDGRTELTPVYDLLSTLPYGDEHMTMKIEGRDANLTRVTFAVAGERFDIPHRATDAMIDELCDQLAPFYARLGEIGFDTKRTRALEKALRKRAEDLSTRSHGKRSS